MSLFDKLRRKLGSSPADAPPPVTAEPALFEQLAGAVADGDEAELAALCRAHADAIVAAFPSWRRVDQELEPAQLQRIVEVLGRTAKVLADELGRPEPWAALTGLSLFEWTWHLHLA